MLDGCSVIFYTQPFFLEEQDGSTVMGLDFVRSRIKLLKYKPYNIRGLFLSTQEH